MAGPGGRGRSEQEFCELGAQTGRYNMVKRPLPRETDTAFGPAVSILSDLQMESTGQTVEEADVENRLSVGRQRLAVRRLSVGRQRLSVEMKTTAGQCHFILIQVSHVFSFVFVTSHNRP